MAKVSKVAAKGSATTEQKVTETQQATHVLAERNGSQRSFPVSLWNMLPGDKEGWREVQSKPAELGNPGTGTAPEVTDAELEQFVNVYNRIYPIGDEPLTVDLVKEGLKKVADDKKAGELYAARNKYEDASGEDAPNDWDLEKLQSETARQVNMNEGRLAVAKDDYFARFGTPAPDEDSADDLYAKIKEAENNATKTKTDDGGTGDGGKQDEPKLTGKQRAQKEYFDLFGKEPVDMTTAEIERAISEHKSK